MSVMAEPWAKRTAAIKGHEFICCVATDPYSDRAQPDRCPTTTVARIANEMALETVVAPDWPLDEEWECSWPANKDWFNKTAHGHIVGN